MHYIRENRILRMTLISLIAVSLFILAFLTSAPCCLPGSGNDGTGKWSASKYNAKLPFSIYGASAIWTGERAYIFGGSGPSGPTDTIMEFDPSDRCVAIMDAKIPNAMMMASAVWLPPYAYIFGGEHNSEILDDVLRYDPKNDTMVVLPYKMPAPRTGSCAVVFNDTIYILGGTSDKGPVNEVLTFFPKNGTFEPFASISFTGNGNIAILGYEKVYMFGGFGPGDDRTVLEMDPRTGMTGVLSAGTEYGCNRSTGIWTGTCALIIGGNQHNETLDQIFEFNPSCKEQKMVMIAALPEPLEQSVSFFDGKNNKTYVMGGRSTAKISDAIYVIGKTDGPQDVNEDTGVTFEMGMFMSGISAVIISVILIQYYVMKKGLLIKHKEKIINNEKLSKKKYIK